MNERREILARLESGRPGALATLVDIEGSSYRGPGARLWISGEDTTGAISGGCLEADLVERARGIMDSGKPQLIDYDTRTDEDLAWGTGLGCGGLARVLLEPWPAARPDLAAFLRACRDENRFGVAATLFERDGVPTAQRLLLRDDGALAHGVADNALRRTLTAEARALLAELQKTSPSLAQGFAKRYESETGLARVLWEPVLPPVPLTIFGGGPDARPVAALAGQLDWRVTVVDHRPRFADPKRFPEATVLLAEGDAYWERVPLDGRAIGLVMNHHFERDKGCLQRLLASNVLYLGVLGPWSRTERLLQALNALPLNERDRERLHAPVGLDIGAETPTEVALAIVAEIRAALSGRDGGPLRRRKGPIHNRK